MILTKEIKVKLNRGNIPHYKQYEEFQKSKIGDVIIVPIKYAPVISKIKVKCDVCGEEREIIYSTYLESTKKQIPIYFINVVTNWIF